MLPRPLLFAVALIALAVPASAATLALFQCPHAEILCLRKLGYNFEKCGPLVGPGGVAQTFPLCEASDALACVPCWFGSAVETRANCTAQYGSACSAFTEQNAAWQDDWDDIDWPDLTPLYLLYDEYID